MVYFTSDTHFGHKKIIEYDKRPFSNIHDHDNALIDNWNETVNRRDVIYFLGDFCLSDKIYTESILRRLNGNKHFIKGNHDGRDMIKLYSKYGVYLGEQKSIKVENKKVVLNHYAMQVWSNSHRGAYQLY